MDPFGSHTAPATLAESMLDDLDDLSDVEEEEEEVEAPPVILAYNRGVILCYVMTSSI